MGLLRIICFPSAASATREKLQIGPVIQGCGEWIQTVSLVLGEVPSATLGRSPTGDEDRQSYGYKCEHKYEGGSSTMMPHMEFTLWAKSPRENLRILRAAQWKAYMPPAADTVKT